MHVTQDVDGAIEVRFVERSHRDFLIRVFVAEACVVENQLGELH
jgi:hypothetical protein